MHGIAFHARPKLNDAFVSNICDQALQHIASQILVGHFASAEAKTGLHLVTFLQKTNDMVPLGDVIVLVHIHAEFNFFQNDLLLVLFGGPFFLFLLVEKLAVVHDPADRWHSIWGNLYQVEVDLAGFLERFIRRQNSKLVALRINHAYLSRADALIHTNKTLIYTILLKMSRNAARLGDYNTANPANMSPGMVRSGPGPYATDYENFVLTATKTEWFSRGIWQSGIGNGNQIVCAGLYNSSFQPPICGMLAGQADLQIVVAEGFREGLIACL